MSSQTSIAIPVEESTNILLSTVPSSLPTFLYSEHATIIRKLFLFPCDCGCHGDVLKKFMYGEWALENAEYSKALKTKTAYA